MQAAIITRQGINVQEVARPNYGKNEILVRVHATTVTRGDVVLKDLPGLMFWPPVRKLLDVPPRKTIPGHEFAGIVEAVGGDVTGYRVGDEVFGTTTGLSAGANAEYVSIPQKSETAVLAHKPRTLSFEEAAALPLGAMTACYLLRDANAHVGQHVLIYGASGSVGSYAVQIAKALGMTVTAVCSTRNIETVRFLGADEVIDYTVEDFSARDTAYDVIFDAVGKTTNAQRHRALKPDGRFTSIRTNTHESDEAFAQIIDRVTAGQLTPLIDHCTPLNEIATVYEVVASGRKRGNIVIQVHSTGA
ncbi:MAG: NAD(P)-dependent alcohol dehydrogenase [Chloroflexota bacterium]